MMMSRLADVMMRRLADVMMSRLADVMMSRLAIHYRPTKNIFCPNPFASIGSTPSPCATAKASAHAVGEGDGGEVLTVNRTTIISRLADFVRTQTNLYVEFRPQQFEFFMYHGYTDFH